MPPLSPSWQIANDSSQNKYSITLELLRAKNLTTTSVLFLRLEDFVHQVVSASKFLLYSRLKLYRTQGLPNQCIS